ncbi:nitrate- and nitrite sensing domain-containing protein [Thiocystis violacea]|uniref:nitrate- and nitrite sensing domain-containing protein n=1 Tax=Thiocystis violacea TaxID=13725 RepID=UPI0019044486|nr:nitrate- and nitrite sensing domain-containing protein [Thiocystis violacea]MBK1722858.1 chemotaxis protein [Thiocystis violacea]
MLNTLRIKTKLLLIAGIPAAALLALTVFGASQLLAELAQVKHAEDVGRVVVALGEVAHALQKERGMSAGFLASKGDTFADRLPAQRQAALTAVAELQAAIGGIDPTAVAPEYRTLLDEAAAGLGDLPDLRTRIGDLKVTPAESFSSYSAIIATLLDIAIRSGNELPDAHLERLANAKSALLYLKERNGQERAILSGAFGAGRITAANFDILLTLLSDQTNYLRLTQAYATPAQQAFLADRLSRPIVAEVARVEQMVRDKGVGADLNYSPTTWFDQITAKIDLLREVEQRFSADIETGLVQTAQATRTHLLAYLGLAGSVLVLTVWLGIWIARGILRQIGGEPAFAVEVARAISDGTLDNAIPLRAGDEDSLLASMKTMQHLLKDRIEKEQRIAAERLRVQIALDKASTNMMLVDNLGNIIFMNAAVARLMRESAPQIRKVLPGFDAGHLLGTPFEALQRHPGGHVGLLTDLRHEQSIQMELGERIFRLVANPVVDADGNRIGAVVEWADRTNEIKAERELANLLDAALRGDFSLRMSTTDKHGFFRQVAEEMNRLMEIVSAGLADIARVLHGIADGDLNQQITADYAGTFGALKADTNATVRQLKKIVGGILESTQSISSAAQEIFMGNSDLSSRTESQAGSLEETASSMEELSQTVQRNAQSAAQANGLADTASQTVQQGGETVKALAGTMGNIQESSRKIADIIGVIDSIAFQTNILALNAAVEAARAGEQGKGFAVVAAEVRQLAQRSAQAAKEIKTLIDESVAQVAGGARLATQAGDEMDAVIRHFKEVATLVSEISAASREQSSEIELVTRAVSQIDEMTQQNAALVEEATAATESLEEQARELSGTVAVFRFDRGEPRQDPPWNGRERRGPRRATNVARIRPTPGPAAEASGPANSRSKQEPAPAPKHHAPRPAREDDDWEEF